MKIGILTLTPSYNYGGILQCMALQNVLKGEGHEVKIINYIYSRGGTSSRRLKLMLRNFNFNEFWNWTIKLIKSKIDTLLKKRNKKISPQLVNICKKFIEENLEFTHSCNEKNIGQLILKESFEAIIIGSDKVWGGLGYKKLIYFGDWNPIFNGKIYSYAACSSLKKVPSFNQNKLKLLLSKFKEISVRDIFTKDLIQPYTNKTIKIVPDPTILYDFGNRKRIIQERYILTYILGNEIKGGHKKIIQDIKDKFENIKVISIVFRNQSTDIAKFADIVLDNIGPNEWIDLIAHTDYLYTDSFHACIFAMKYKRNFIGYYSEENRSTRLISLSKIFNIDKFIINSYFDFLSKDTINSEPDYSQISKVLIEYKKVGINFIKLLN